MRAPYILLVEDDPDDLLLTRRVYQQSGCSQELVVVENGEAALAMLLPPSAAPPPAPDLVMLDLRLPRIEGAEVLRRLRAEAPMRSVPIVILTSSREERDVTQCYALGANSYLYKPVEFSAYRDMLMRLWNYWLSLNVTAQRAWP